MFSWKVVSVCHSQRSCSCYSYSVIINLTLWRRHGIYMRESICLCDRLPLLPARRWFFGVCLHAAAAPQTQLSPAIKLKLPTASINNNVLINYFSPFPRWLETNSRVYFAICHQKLITRAPAVAIQKFPLTQSNRDYLCSTRLDRRFFGLSFVCVHLVTFPCPI